MKDSEKNLGNHLKSLRNATGKSGDEVARAMGASHGSVSHYENNRRTPDLQSVSLYLDAVEASTEDRLATLEILLGHPVDQLPALNDQQLYIWLSNKIEQIESQQDRIKDDLKYIRDTVVRNVLLTTPTPLSENNPGETDVFTRVDVLRPEDV